MKAKKPNQKQYNHLAIEKKWQKKWASTKLYKSTEDPKKDKFYVLDMFPYPSGEGLHVGHPKGYIATDIISRMKRMQGKSVLHPMGFDAFGLPAENYALKTKTHPEISTKKNVARYKEQLENIGLDYDWSREINTTDPEYYRWTQWIFLQLYKKGLAYESFEPINWCPSCKTGLANEDLEDGRCERCGTPVEKKPLRQWVLKITDYAERLLNDLDIKDASGKGMLDWPSSIKELQKNWIGKSEGVEIDFTIDTIGAKPNFLILHGYTGSAKKNFIPWLKENLEKQGFEVQAPELPNTKTPSEEEQVGYVLDNCRIDKDTIIIGHSLGCAVAIKSLMKSGKKIRRLILVAPVMDPKHRKDGYVKSYHKTFEWNYDFRLVKSLVSDISILSDLQEDFRVDYLKFLAENFSANLIESRAEREHYCAAEEPDILNVINSSNPKIRVFTTRPDTLFGVTYVVLAPEHTLVQQLLSQVKNKAEVEAYIAQTARETEMDRTDAKKKKTGVELKGVNVINPANGEKVPVWIADYVLADYGTGAVMAVPAHDERDWDFAKKFGLPVKQVIAPYFTKSDRDNARPDKKTVTRKTAYALLYDKKTDKFLCLDWRKFNWHSGIIGGLDEGESFKDAAIREIREETGYTDIKYIKELGGEQHNHFFAAHKDENRYGIGRGMLFELVSDKKVEVKEEDTKNHETVWIPRKDMGTWLNLEAFKYMWEVYTSNAESYVGSGKLINSGSFDGTLSEEAKWKIAESVGGKKITKYKLRDWVFARQRYWGEPIPLIHCERCGVVPVPEEQLPVTLPKVKSYEPTGTGESPLAAISKWVNVKCPKCIAQKNETKYFIFDFDGVLGDTWEVMNNSKVKMGDAETFEQAAEQALKHFDSRPNDSRGHTLTPEQMKKREEWIRTFGKHVAESKFKLFEGLIKEIKKIKNTKLAVVSAGSEQYVIPALKKSGLKFTHVLSYEDHHSKEEKIEKICKDWKVDVKDIYYFTDTKADVYELENQLDRSKIVGCAWGYMGFDKLAEVLPTKQILEDFKDIHRFFNTDCAAKRETNTMPQWAGSSWYYLRYMDVKNKKAAVDLKKEKYWSPVDLYVGGAEHATRHLIYSRFWHKVLYDLGYVSTIEPFKKLQHVGLIMGEDGRKMGKRYGNVVNPDDVIKTYGADTLRIYEMFMGPFDQQIAWSTDSMIGGRRFIERIWKLKEKVTQAEISAQNTAQINKIIHKTIKKVTEDIENLRFNTAISSLMIAVNELEKAETLDKTSYESLLKLVAPFAPHITEELWTGLKNKKSIHISEWPQYDEKLTIDNEVTIMVQINGKVRGSFITPRESTKDVLESTAQSLPDVKKWLEGKVIKKIITIPGKMVSIVVGE